MMMTMDYGSQYTTSSFGSDTLSGSLGSGRPPRIRTVRLVRPNLGPPSHPGLTCRHGPSLGFSVRGGREYGTGFFISHVEPASEAQRQGLKAGDQIVRVNGFPVEDAVHKEVVQLISNQTYLTMKIRSVGMIPVKDKKTDPLSWQIMTDYNSSTRSSPQLGLKIHDVKISILVAPRTKLGCGICKGPEWKPGIFVQFTKEAGIAREAGLRPGDQILCCNNVDFSDVPFNMAVNLMKGARQLDLIVRKGAGSELFPSESSGYNSSASSVTGDQSPSWSDSKRLSIVKEESLDLEDRLTQLDRFKAKKWEKIEWDDDGEKKQQNHYPYKSTVINLQDNTSTINVGDCNRDEGREDMNTLGRNKANKIADICLVSRQQETKTVVVEVHRSDEKMALAKSLSVESFNSVASRSSNASGTTLSSAICDEIQRRAAQRNNITEAPTIDEQLQMKKIMKGVDTEKQQQHTQLMDEFRKAHRKMFKGMDGCSSETNEEDAKRESCNQLTDRNSNKPKTTSSIVQQTIAERLSHINHGETSQEKSSTQHHHHHNGINPVSSQLHPPPPPPLPLEDNSNTYDHTDNAKSPLQSKQKTKAPPPPVPLKSSPSNQPPPCPTPDYDTLSISSTSTLPKTPKSTQINGFGKRDLVHSFSLNGDSPTQQEDILRSSGFSRPKSLNSNVVQNGAGKMQRPVSVAIGEYPSGTVKRQPKKLDFLNNNSNNNNNVERNGKENGYGSVNGQSSVVKEFASELSQTLNRWNLKKKTESMENLLERPQIKTIGNGSVRISINNGLANTKRHLAKSTNDLSSFDCPSDSNRVTISIPSREKPTTPNGILKQQNTASVQTKTIPMQNHQKSITFGEMPTLINENPLPVT